ncbi:MULTISPECIES: hypothetical protein, partial [unclassified Pseudoalteromonas]|uniref:hypothetical protein n=1 Tax=unclassified Pseudoalteromonas TaxID=194690 RepID=UPI0015FED24B
MLTTNVAAQDYYAPQNWDITNSFTIESGDRMYITADSKVTLENSARLIVAKGAELIVEAGATVTFDIKSRIDVRGEWLIAQGVTIQSGSGVQFNIY